MKNIFIAGHNGMVGSALQRELSKNNEVEIIVRNRDSLDLMNQKQVLDFFQTNNIDEIYLAAAKVGGIYANATYPANFIYENLMIQSNVIHAAHQCDIDKILFLGSSCIYPKHAAQPIEESSLLTGSLESTNEPYAIAKIAGIKMCAAYNKQYDRDYRSVMPTNLYGPGDNFHEENSHVVPALMRRFHEANANKQDLVTIWGSGQPMREFLHVDDMASASVHIMQLEKTAYSKVIGSSINHINVGTGKDCTIKELAELISKVTDYKKIIEFDSTKPDGTPRKLLSVDLLYRTGWKYKIELEQGLKSTYQWYKENLAGSRK